MKTNTKTRHTETTHEGAPSARINHEQQLRRSVMACLLWEDSFYEEGQSIAARICGLVPAVRAEAVAAMAVEAREKMKLRHVPLLLCREMAKLASHKQEVAATLARVIQRADELCEFLSIYSEGRTGTKKLNKLCNQVRKGLAEAFGKFDEYSLAKYNHQNAIKLKDVLFLCHAKPKDAAQDALWKRLIKGELQTPDTWEVELSASKDKKASWTRLLQENKLGGLALLRNLRNFKEAKIDESIIASALKKMKVERVLPFRFITAANYAPHLESELESAMFRCLASQEKLPGKTVLVVDVSGSMFGGGNISKHSELTRVDAACGLAMLLREVCEQPVIYATGGCDHTRIHATQRVPSRRGFALRDVIQNGMREALGGGGIFLVQCMDHIKKEVPEANRVIVITDEQDCDLKLKPDNADAFGKCNYLINISVEKNGVGYGKWTHLDGWSEAIVEYIRASETVQETA